MKPNGSKKLTDDDLRAIDLLCRKSLKKFLQSLPPERLKELFISSKYTTEEPLPEHLRLEHLIANQYQKQRLNDDATKNRNLKVLAPAVVTPKNISKRTGANTTAKKHAHLTVKSGDIPSTKLVGCFPCEWPGCTIRRGSRSSVRQHMNIHLKTYKCTVCSKCLETASDLRRHYKFHDNFWAFECNVCGKAYKHQWHLNTHTLKVHSGLPPPHACPNCVYSTWNWADLCGHRVRIHQWNWSNPDAESV